MKTGDVVRLKSGGPNMTLVGTAPLVGDPSVRWWVCRWFEQIGPTHGIRQEQFPEEALELVEAG